MARLTLLILAFSICFSSVLAQTTSVTYQGKLTDGSNPANGQYDFVFRLFDSSGTQIGGDLEKGDVQVTGGVFTVSLNFGVSLFSAGAADSLEIGVRPGTSTGLYTTLTPRQPLASSPFTIRSLSAGNADSASDSAKLGGVAANQYVATTDPRLTDARTPTAGSDNYVQNRTTPQGGNFNLSGDGVVHKTFTFFGNRIPKIRAQSKEEADCIRRTRWYDDVFPPFAGFLSQFQNIAECGGYSRRQRC